MENTRRFNVRLKVYSYTFKDGEIEMVKTFPYATADEVRMFVSEYLPMYYTEGIPECDRNIEALDNALDNLEWYKTRLSTIAENGTTKSKVYSLYVERFNNYNGGDEK